MGYLVLLRHGQSQWNLENRFTGFHDVELSELGRKEAAQSGNLIKQAGFKFDKVFTSTLKRAFTTGEIALRESEARFSTIFRTCPAGIALCRVADGSLVGDVEFETARNHAAFITPVPGGVGPMTVASLMENTLSACQDYHDA